MTRILSSYWFVAFLFLVDPVVSATDAPADKPGAKGTVPLDAAGRPLNLGFETGTLADWTAEGSAFEGQPIEGDTVNGRRRDMHGAHVGQFWVGSYERSGDQATGTLTSVPFRASKPFASFLVGGGSHAGTRVEIVQKDTGRVIFRAHGDDQEGLDALPSIFRATSAERS